MTERFLRLVAGVRVDNLAALELADQLIFRDLAALGHEEPRRYLVACSRDGGHDGDMIAELARELLSRRIQQTDENRVAILDLFFT